MVCVKAAVVSWAWHAINSSLGNLASGASTTYHYPQGCKKYRYIRVSHFFFLIMEMPAIFITSQSPPFTSINLYKYHKKTVWYVSAPLSTVLFLKICYGKHCSVLHVTLRGQSQMQMQNHYNKRVKICNTNTGKLWAWISNSIIIKENQKQVLVI